MKKNLKVAIVHEYLTALGGAERVLFEILDLYPKADLFVLTFSPNHLPDWANQKINKHKIFVSGLKYIQKFTPLVRILVPYAIEKFYLKNYDLVISNCNSYAKGIIVPQDTIHISYIHSPTRYLWDYVHKYLDEHTKNYVSRWFLRTLFFHQRKWDFLAAQRPDVVLANSENVRERIRKYYCRRAEVIYPPVNIKNFYIAPKKKNYFLVVSRLSPYKKVDLVVQTFKNLSDLTLKIAGEGPERPNLEKIAKGNQRIQFLGFVSDENLKKLYAEARAVIFPQEEDFGLVPIEAAASGTPTIAFKKGGALETILDGKTGIFFKEQTEKSLFLALKKFLIIEDQFNPYLLREHAKSLDSSLFRKKFLKIVEHITSFKK